MRGIHPRFSVQPLLNPYPKLEPYPKQRRMMDLTTLNPVERIKLYALQTRQISNPYKQRYDLSDPRMNTEDKFSNVGIALNPRVLEQKDLIDSINELRSYKPIALQSPIHQDITRRRIIDTNRKIIKYMGARLSHKNAAKRKAMVEKLLIGPDTGNKKDMMLYKRLSDVISTYASLGLDEVNDLFNDMKEAGLLQSKKLDKGWQKAFSKTQFKDTKDDLVDKLLNDVPSDELFIMTYFLLGDGGSEANPKAGLEMLLGNEPTVGDKLDAKIFDEDSDEKKKKKKKNNDSDDDDEFDYDDDDDEPEPTNAATSAAVTSNS